MKDFSAPEATILLLDSDPVMRAGLRAALDDAGYLVLTAADVGEAVDRLAEIAPDLLITRPYIDSMTGRTAADYLRDRHHGLPILIVAGFMEADPIAVQNATGEYHTFPKPFSREQLLAKVRDVLDMVRKKG